MCLRKLATYHAFNVYKTYVNVHAQMQLINNLAMQREIQVLSQLIRDLDQECNKSAKKRENKFCCCLFWLNNRVNPGLFKLNI